MAEHIGMCSSLVTMPPIHDSFFLFSYKRLWSWYVLSTYPGRETYIDIVHSVCDMVGFVDPFTRTSAFPLASSSAV